MRSPSPLLLSCSKRPWQLRQTSPVPAGYADSDVPAADGERTRLYGTYYYCCGWCGPLVVAEERVGGGGESTPLNGTLAAGVRAGAAADTVAGTEQHTVDIAAAQRNGGEQ